MPGRVPSATADHEEAIRIADDRRLNDSGHHRGLGIGLRFEDGLPDLRIRWQAAHMPLHQPDVRLSEKAALRLSRVVRVDGFVQLDGAHDVEGVVTHQVVHDHLLSAGPRRIVIGPLADSGVEKATEAYLGQNMMVGKRFTQRMVEGLLGLGQWASLEKLRPRGRVCADPEAENVRDDHNTDDNKNGYRFHFPRPASFGSTRGNNPNATPNISGPHRCSL